MVDNLVYNCNVNEKYDLKNCEVKARNEDGKARVKIRQLTFIIVKYAKFEELIHIKHTHEPVPFSLFNCCGEITVI